MKKEIVGGTQEFYISDRRLYLTADKSKVVEEGDLEARFLYATEGTRIPAADAIRFGLVKSEKAAPKSEDKAAPKSADKAKKKASKK